MAFPDIWGEGTAMVSICASGGSYIQFAPIISSIDIDMGDKDFESIPTTRGGRLEKRTPEADTMVTFEGYPVNMNTASTDLIQRFFTTRANWDTAEAYDVTNSRNRDDFAVVICWTENTVQTTADGITNAEALRFIATKARLVSVKPAFTDNELKFTFKFKCAPYRSDGTANLRWQGNDDSPTLAALAAYTGQAASAL